MNIRNYLLAIEEGRPINLQRFFSLLPAGVRLSATEIYRGEKCGRTQYRVSVLDLAAHQQLLKGTLAPDADRLDATAAGNSHDCPTPTAYLLTYHHTSTGARLDVVRATEWDGLDYPFTPQRELLLIENETNFFRYRDMLTLLQPYCPATLSLEQVDIAFASGFRIADPLLDPFLRQYQRLWCAFDFDLGGLQLYRHLRQRLGGGVLWLIDDPSHLQHRFVKKPKELCQLQQAIELATVLHKPAIASMLRNTCRFMEQESLLSEIAS